MARSRMAMIVAGMMAAAGPALANGPVVPCGGAAPLPAPAATGAMPAISTWARAELGGGWQPPTCSGWTGTGARSLVALSGRLRIPGGTAGILARFGAISHTKGVRYWSYSGGRWETLVLAAHALTDTGALRADFMPAEMAPGQILAFRQTDNDSGEVSYRMDIREAGDGGVIVTSENTSTMRRLLVSLFSPGELQTLYVLHPEGGDVWSFYGLTRVREGASGLTDGHEASIINRGVALFRHLGGIPTDQNPPARR